MVTRRNRRRVVKENRARSVALAELAPEDRPGLRQCVDCGTVYELKALEAAWFTQRGMSLPRRCPACREIRRAEKAVGA